MNPVKTLRQNGIVAKAFGTVIRPTAVIVLSAALPVVGLIVLGVAGEDLLVFLGSVSSEWRALLTLSVGGILVGLALLPSHATSLLCGWFFGGILGSLLALMTVTIAMVMSYLVGKLLTGRGLMVSIQQDERWEAMRAALLEDDPLRSSLLVALLRVSPLAPFAATNVAFAALGAPLSSYLFGSLIGLTPRVLIVVLFGASASEIDWSSPETPGLFVFGLIAALIAIFVAGRLTRKTLRAITQ